MDFLDAGAQYKVYTLSGERVRKVPNTTAEALGVIASWYAYDAARMPEFEATAAQSVEGTANTAEYFKELLGQFPELGGYLGNPVFNDDGSYDQNKATVLREVLTQCSNADARTIFEQYAAAKLYEWEFGFSDAVFNPTVNNGLTSDNKIILLDFGEVATDMPRVHTHIAEKKWLKQWSYTQGMPRHLRAVYAEVMDVTVTPDNLELYWRKRLLNS